MLGSARAEALSYSAVKLFSKNSNLCDHGTWTLHTDRQTISNKVHRAVKKQGILAKSRDSRHLMKIAVSIISLFPWFSTVSTRLVTNSNWPTDFLEINVDALHILDARHRTKHTELCRHRLVLTCDWLDHSLSRSPNIALHSQVSSNTYKCSAESINGKSFFIIKLYWNK